MCGHIVVSNVQLRSFLHGAHYSWNSWKAPGILKFSSRALENSWNFKETFSLVFKTNQNLQKHLTPNCIFVFYVDSISVGCYCGRNYLILLHFCMPRRREKLGWVLEKYFLYPEKLQEFSYHQSVRTMFLIDFQITCN